MYIFRSASQEQVKYAVNTKEFQTFLNGDMYEAFLSKPSSSSNPLFSDLARTIMITTKKSTVTVAWWLLPLWLYRLFPCPFPS